MKNLYLVRHAKSSWDDSSLADQQRPLNNRGLKNAPEMGRRLADAGLSLDLIVSSPANRAFSTASFLATAIGYEIEQIQKRDEMYFDGPSAMLEIIRNTEPALQSLMLVGHNPDMTSFLNSLCGFQTGNMPTCAIASIEFDCAWSEVTYDSGALLYYDFPKKPDP